MKAAQPGSGCWRCIIIIWLGCPPSTFLSEVMRPITGRSGQATRVMQRVTSYSRVDSVRGLKRASVSSRSPHTATRPK